MGALPGTRWHGDTDTLRRYCTERHPARNAGVGTREAACGCVACGLFVPKPTQAHGAHAVWEVSGGWGGTGVTEVMGCGRV